jgi:hypothetical protein
MIQTTHGNVKAAKNLSQEKWAWSNLSDPPISGLLAFCFFHLTNQARTTTSNVLPINPIDTDSQWKENPLRDYSSRKKKSFDSTRRQVQLLDGWRPVQSLGFLGNNIGVLDLYPR